ncbi:site-2 protease family protein [Oscillatoria salina]|uniref:site-2 protease family protein n=1 Tax=Oscillatoria salina TaxID=331517 RepID=UPI0013B9AE35|nr:site-2 protease family protein [Oscillatoria salina]MBZ8181274.1 site-2 protease family protein [Oscillatoria salina IIICB1]NET86839.1 site-2 protease family protein [Kamptonema sp. SIO1D9]
MFNGSDTIATFSIVLVALGILIWGYNRARSYGKLGILAWLQSVVLMAPWLLFFGLFSAGIYLNLVGILFLLVASAGGYIYLGRRLRQEGQDAILRERASQRLKELEAENNAEGEVRESSEPTDNTENAYHNVGAAIAPEVLPIPDDDLKTIKGIFGIDTFFATETISYQEGAIFRGNLRNDPDRVHSRLSASLKERLGEKYRLFLVESPEGKPVVIILPSTDDPQPATIAQKVLAVVLFVATIATSLEAAGILLGFDFFTDISRFQEVLPLSLGLWTILAAHEIAHQVIAKKYDLRFSFPFFIPSWQIGAFGGINRFESLIPSRTALFDVAFAGPAIGGIISLLMLIAGLILSHPGSLFKLPTEFFQGSVLVGSLAKVVLGSALQEPIVDIHPLTIIGWLGLVITALNLLPAGQLDGGRIVLAIYGRKTARRTTIATLVLIGIVAIFNPSNPIPLYWGILILFLQRNLERPSLNELSEPDDARAALGLLALFLTLATLIPLTPSVAGSLGIGGG